MKRKVYLPITIVLAIGLIVLILVLNKKSTTAKTQALLAEDSAVAVRTEVVSESDYTADFTANGLVEGVQDLSFVSSLGGRVVSLYADEGDHISKGKLLIQLDAETLRADAEASRVAYEAAKKDYERFQQAHDQGGVTDQQLSTMHTQMVAAQGRYISSRSRLTDASIKAPISGQIYKRYVEAGSYVNPGTKLFDIVDDSQLKASCFVTERQRLQLTKGQTVSVESELYPGQTITGKISMIGDKANHALAFPVNVTLDKQSADGLRPGMYVSISFGSQQETHGILIPRRAIVGSVKDAHVYVVEQGVAKQKAITAGSLIGDRIEVLSGLQAGDSVIVAGLINVSDGLPVKTINE